MFICFKSSKNKLRINIVGFMNCCIAHGIYLQHFMGFISFSMYTIENCTCNLSIEVSTHD